MATIPESLAGHMALANGYPSLLSRLKRDNAVMALAKRESKVLLSELRSSLNQFSGGFEEQVMPYAYIAALFLKRDRKSLKAARKFAATPFHEWYASSVDFLISQMISSNDRPVGGVVKLRPVGYNPSVIKFD